ncbi:BspA family leucine-rich repeat surface protein [Enterococcus faecalis]|uniref:BspA family leucine-rich repeat surface protein n=1 Tax=Enterococcus faecalis TaxID=1351 RepID=UPI0021C5EF78|nr:BspA family leucine-rich repeat surface protein [Enterococcus faecalis]MCU2243127.1 BspA family leucine-rich repeat surface protein [Enterococcus faecalis]
MRKIMSTITVISLFSTILLPVVVTAEEAKSEEVTKTEISSVTSDSDESLKSNESISSGEINITDNSNEISKSDINPTQKKEVVSSNDDIKKEKEDEAVSDSVKANYKNSNTLNINDWDVVDEGSYYLITKYTGNSSDIVVPNEINGKLVKLSNINKSVFPNYSSIVRFEVPSNGSNKVELMTTTANEVFDDSWSSLSYIDISGLDTKNVTSMDNMFRYCKASTINIKDINTKNVTTMSGMFWGCENVENLDVSNFDTSNVTNMYAMFFKCKKIKNLDVSKFDTNNVTNMYYMFANTNLSTLDVSNFNTENVQKMVGMFNHIPNLKVLDLSNFKIRQDADIRNLSNFIFADGLNPTPLLIIASDPVLLSMNYSSQYRIPVELLLNANGGIFNDNTREKNYFTKCAITPQEISLDKLEEFKKNNIPEKKGFFFDGYTTTTDTSQATSILDLIGTVYDAQWKVRTVSLEVPTAISFGTHKLSKGTNYYSVDTVEGTGLSVTDDRGIGSKWQLTAKLQTPFTNNGKILSNSLVYKTSSGEEVITENAAQVIETHTTSTDSEKTVISDNWTNTQGLMLKLEEGKAYAGEYDGTIEWTLNDTP